MSNSNDNSGLAIVIAFFGVFAMFWAMMIGFLLALAALILTIIALCAWNKPLTLGDMTITPYEARTFVARGLYGAWLFPVFLMLIDLLPDITINGRYWPYYVIAGYVLGSLGVEYLMEQLKEHTPPAPAAAPQIAPPPAPHVITEPAKGEFRFARHC